MISPSKRHRDTGHIIPCLRQLDRIYPLSHALLIGAGNGTGRLVAFLREKICVKATLVEADEIPFRHLKSSLDRREGWAMHCRIVAPVSGTAIFYRTTVRTENGLLPPRADARVWGRIKERERISRDAITLDSVMAGLSVPADWLLIDCLPAASILAPASEQLEDVVVVVVRVCNGSIPENCGVDDILRILGPKGFRILAQEDTRDPSTSHVVLARDPLRLLQDMKALEQAAEELQGRIATAESSAAALEAELKQTVAKCETTERRLSRATSPIPITLSAVAGFSRLFTRLESESNDPDAGTLESLRHHHALAENVKSRLKPLIAEHSMAQLRQDLWVLERCHYKRGGFFVEFGATDGISLSNTYLLEKEFDWVGICAEPNPKYFKQLTENRTCTLACECIGPVSGETVEFVYASEYGGMMRDLEKDEHKDKRKPYVDTGQTEILTTISLHDFLAKHHAPPEIDYLSMDTEGSEFSILENFPFDIWKIMNISVEHNYTEDRLKIRNLLFSKGYKLQEAEWDDWYYLGDH